jgi:hypothetical protein
VPAALLAADPASMRHLAPGDQASPHGVPTTPGHVGSSPRVHAAAKAGRKTRTSRTSSSPILRLSGEAWLSKRTEVAGRQVPEMHDRDHFADLSAPRRACAGGIRELNFFRSPLSSSTRLWLTCAARTGIVPDPTITRARAFSLALRFRYVVSS